MVLPLVVGVVVHFAVSSFVSSKPLLNAAEGESYVVGHVNKMGEVLPLCVPYMYSIAHSTHYYCTHTHTMYVHMYTTGPVWPTQRGGAQRLAVQT